MFNSSIRVIFEFKNTGIHVHVGVSVVKRKSLQVVKVVFFV